MKYSDHAKLVEGLTELLEFVKAHPELPIRHPEFTLTQWVYDEKEITAKDQLAKAAKAMGRASKNYVGEWFDLRRKFGPITLEFTTNRSAICKRVVTGTKVVPAEIVPERIIEERTEEVVEWICDEPLLATSDNN